MQRTVSLTLAYVLFALACLGLFTLWLFPYENFKAWLAEKAQAASGLNVSITELGPAYLPPGFVLTGTTLAAKGANSPVLLQLPELKASLALVPLLTAKLGAALSGSLYDGEITLTAASGALFDFKTPELTVNLEDVRLDQNPALSGLVGVQSLTGSLSGDLGLSREGDPGEFQGAGSIRAKDLAIGIALPFLRDDRLDLGSGEATFSVKGPVITLGECRLKSKTFEAELKGTITVLPGQKSVTFDLAGTWRIDPAAVDMAKLPSDSLREQLRQRKQLPLRITGQPGALQIMPI